MLSNQFELLAYTRKPAGMYEETLANSMHLAYRVSGSEFVPLNHNYGVLFAKAVENENRTLTAKNLASPYIFQLATEEYGIVAVRTECDGTPDERSKGKIMLFTTRDFLQYTEHGLMDLESDHHIRYACCEYLAQEQRYLLQWCDETNQTYQAMFANIFEPKIAPVPAQMLKRDVIETTIEGAQPANILAIPTEIAEKLLERLTVPENIGMNLPKTVTVASEQELQAVRAEYLYSDGTVVSRAIRWNSDAIDWSKERTHTITGEVAQPSYHFPFAINRADPCVFHWQGHYYYIATNDADDNNSLSVRKAATMEQLATAAEYEILNTRMYDHMVQFLWAPEIHLVGEDIYIFLASSPKGFEQIRCHAMRLKPGGEIRNKSDWEKPKPIQRRDGEYLCSNGLTLDMTYFAVRGKSYVAWAQRDMVPYDLGSWICVAEVDVKKPWQLISDPVVLSKPDYSWSNNHVFVEEGPYPLFLDNNKLMLTFSGALIDYTYCIGYLMVDLDADLLNAASWTKGNYPLLTAFSVSGETGTGHNAFIREENGTTWCTYHARVGKDGPRSSGFRRVHFHRDGFPVLDLTEDRDIKLDYRNLTLQVVVKKPKTR